LQFADYFYEDAVGEFAAQEVNYAVFDVAFENLAGGLGGGRRSGRRSGWAKAVDIGPSRRAARASRTAASVRTSAAGWFGLG